MSSADKNLSSFTIATLENPANYKIAIVRSAWNDEITSTLHQGAIDILLANGIDRNNIAEFHVPGSYELPMGAKIALNKGPVDAVICLGCVIRGETDHDKYINQAVANGLMQLSLMTSVPCIFGLLTVNSMEQALDRSGGRHGNKGEEAAATALNMIALSQRKSKKSSIGF